MIFWLLIGLVVLSPFPLASVPPWSSGLMACAVAVLLIAWGVTIAFGSERPPVAVGNTRAFLIPIALAAGRAAIQAMPIAPDALDHPLWRSDGAALRT